MVLQGMGMGGMVGGTYATPRLSPLSSLSSAVAARHSRPSSRHRRHASHCCYAIIVMSYAGHKAAAGQPPCRYVMSLPLLLLVNTPQLRARLAVMSATWHTLLLHTLRP